MEGAAAGVYLLRGTVVHVPGDPFARDDALEWFQDGALAVRDGRVLDLADYAALRRRFPSAAVEDRRGAFLLPGLVDAHVHLPQVAALGGVGLTLLPWLERRALPEEARFAAPDYARARARAFLRLLARSGTTTALVFGAHFAPAMEAFFEEAERSRLRITAGLNVSDRGLLEPLHTTAERAARESVALARRWHGVGRLRYAVTPRFALSCGEALLEACGGVLEAVPGALVTTHLNENPDEIRTVLGRFAWARDYLEVYDRHGLVGARSVFAHDVHPRPRELEALGAAGASVAHCPTSNLGLGSGLFPLRSHLRHGVRLALGSDVGAGSGFGVLKEALAAHQVQMTLGEPPLTPAQLLYLATAAGAAALGLAGEVGAFHPGAQADVVALRPPSGSTLAEVLAGASDADEVVAELVTLAGEESVREVRVGGEVVYAADAPAGWGRGSPPT